MVVSLESAKPGFLEDVGMGGGGMCTAEIDSPPTLVGLVSEERDVHVRRKVESEEKERKKREGVCQRRGGLRETVPGAVKHANAYASSAT